MAKVFLGVGHGGADSGAVANGFKEKNINLVMALSCNETLARHGVITLMSRTKDETDTLSQEVAECNAFAPDLAVDIHNNAGGGDGAEAFYHYKGGTGKALAQNILAEIVKLGQNSRGAKTRTASDGKDWYGFIRNTKAPAVIVEGAFLDNAADVQAIDTEAEQKAFGVAIAKGILQTLGIEYKPAVPAKAEKQETDSCKADYTLGMDYLRKGDKGEAVKALQILLIGRGYSCGGRGADGDFGTATDTAVRAFQKAKGLKVDGVVDKDTMSKLLGI